MFPADAPIDWVPKESWIFGLGKRQPRAVSQAVRLPKAKGCPAWGTAYGARDMLSTPPATKTSPSPALMARTAALTAAKDEAHKRLKVTAATSTGRPASGVAMRATLPLSSPGWVGQPRGT